MDGEDTPTRRIFAYMNLEEKREALARVTADLKVLEHEGAHGSYIRVVQDAIEEAVVRYRRDVAYLRQVVENADE